MRSASDLRVCLTLVGLLALGDAAPTVPASGVARIQWDTYGVPHITAGSTPALFRAFGWAQMESHGQLVLTLYGQARGRGAEYWGEKYLASDRWVRTNGIPQRAAAWYAAQTPSFRECLDAFTAGANDYARQHADLLSPDSRRVLPITPVDVLAHVERVVFFSFIVSPQKMAAEINRRSPGSSPQAERDPSPPGSNAWAIGPSRTAAGHTLLVANPHLPWGDQYTFYEAQLTAPGVDEYGAALVGFPVLGIAFNDALGWSHTVNTNDSADLFELAPADGGYRWNDGVRAFDSETEQVRVRQPDGRLREEDLSIRRSVHGPVFTAPDGRLIALRVAGLDEPGLCEEWWDMGRARSLAEFERALGRLQIPMFTVIYADRVGHILHVFNARVPARAPGAYEWSGVVPGSSSQTLWTHTLPYDALPRLLDPPSGWLQNANDPPWTTTFPLMLDPNRYPAYLAPRTMGFRAQRAVRMLQRDARLTLDQVIADKYSTRMELADRILDDLVAAARRRGGARDLEAAGVLEHWDRSADADSRGAVLFAEFVRRWWATPGRFEHAWSEASPLDTPRGLANPDAAVTLLEAAADDVQRRFGAMDVAWGTVNRFRRGGLDLPGNGAPGDPLGVVRAIGYQPDPDGKAEATDGDSYIAVVEFARPVRAMSLINYGNASQPGSPHAADQLTFALTKRLRPVWLTAADVAAHLERTEVF